VRGDRAVFCRDLARHHLEKREAVGRGQRVTVFEIHLELAVGVLVVGLINAPAKLVAECCEILKIGEKILLQAGLVEIGETVVIMAGRLSGLGLSSSVTLYTVAGDIHETVA